MPLPVLWATAGTDLPELQQPPPAQRAPVSCRGESGAAVLCREGSLDAQPEPTTVRFSLRRASPRSVPVLRTVRFHSPTRFHGNPTHRASALPIDKRRRFHSMKAQGRRQQSCRASSERRASFPFAQADKGGLP